MSTQATLRTGIESEVDKRVKQPMLNWAVLALVAFALLGGLYLAIFSHLA